MRTPREIYAQYNIMPTLQLHQMRVAAVAKLICKHMKTQINERDVLLECLFHDMGNIIKFDLTYFPEFVQPEGLEYWEQVKADFIKRYSKEQHAANAAIVREIGLPQRIIDIMDKTGFSRIPEVVGSDSLELKVCQYADGRVGPHGVLPMEERIEEGRKRYLVRAQKGNLPDRDDVFRAAALGAQQLEQQIFSQATIKPEDINDASVAPIIEELWEYRLA